MGDRPLMDLLWTVWAFQALFSCLGFAFELASRLRRWRNGRPAIDGPAVDGLVSWSNRYKIQNITKAWRDRRPTNRTILERRKVRYNFYRDGKV